MAFGAILAGLGSYIASNNKRKRDEAQQAQARQDALNQQNWLNAYETAQQQISKRNAADNEAIAGVTYDPVTGKATLNPAAALPKQYQEVSPNNKGKRQPAKGSLDDLQQQYAHASQIANYYASQPGLANQQAAKSWMERATQIDALIRQASTAQDQFNKELLIQDREDNRSNSNHQFEASLHGAPTYRDLHPRANSLSIEAAPADPGVMVAAQNAIAHPPKGMTSGQVAERIIANIYQKRGMDNKTRAATIDAVRALGQQYTAPSGASLLQVTPTNPGN